MKILLCIVIAIGFLPLCATGDVQKKVSHKGASISYIETTESSVTWVNILKSRSQVHFSGYMWDLKNSKKTEFSAQEVKEKWQVLEHTYAMMNKIEYGPSLNKNT